MDKPKEELTHAIAQAWCTKENCHKEMDVILAMAIFDKIWPFYESIKAEVDDLKESVMELKAEKNASMRESELLRNEIERLKKVASDPMQIEED